MDGSWSHLRVAAYEKFRRKNINDFLPNWPTTAVYDKTFTLSSTTNFRRWYVLLSAGLFDLSGPTTATWFASRAMVCFDDADELMSFPHKKCGGLRE